MKILIAGFGSVGRRHFRNLLALGERDIVFYRSNLSTLSTGELAGYPVETDLSAALAQRPEAVIVSNPTALHLEVAVPAAEAGCHLLLEKPVSHSLEGVDDLQAAVNRGGGQVLVGFQFRFHPGLQTVARLLSSAAAGRPLSVRAVYGEYLPGIHPWEDYRRGYSAREDLGGGVILTFCHPIDTLRWLLGEVESLWAFAGQTNDLGIQVVDNAEIGLKFSSGILGSIHLDYNQRPSAHKLEIVCTEGTICWDNADGSVSLYQAGAKDWVTYPAPPGFDRNELFLAEMRQFLAVARHEAQPVCTLEDGLQALRIALAAQQSAEEGRLVKWNV